MDFFDTLGPLGLGSRFKRLGDSLMTEVRTIYRTSGIDFEPRWFPLFFLLRKERTLTVTDAAAVLQVPHPYVSQLIKEMRAAKLIAFRRHPEDGRSRIVSLSATGDTLAETLEPLWMDLKVAVETVLATLDTDLITQLKRLETALETQPLSALVETRRAARERKDGQGRPRSSRMAARE